MHNYYGNYLVFIGQLCKGNPATDATKKNYQNVAT
jgi:hypothetical protein